MRWDLLIASLTCTSVLGAQEKPAAPETQSTVATGAATQVRKDPKGVTGISPFFEKLIQGDSRAVARDFDGAIAAYRAAIVQSPQNPLGHYRVAQAFALKADFKEAELAYDAALRFAGADNTLKGKILFCMADLRERQKAYDDAIAGWTSYEEHARAHATAKTFPASAAERKKRNEEWKKISRESAEVKLRSEKRLKEADESARKRAR